MKTRGKFDPITLFVALPLALLPFANKPSVTVALCNGQMGLAMVYMLLSLIVPGPQRAV